MNDIEAIICLILLFMSVPDFCRRVLKRPALIYSVFVLFGLLLGPLVSDGVAAMLKQAGKVGFLLLLFEVGLEITLPKAREVLHPLRLTLKWVLIQYPVILLLAMTAGLNLREAFFAAAALTGCSVGMAYSAWKNFEGFTEDGRRLTLQVMVLLEMLAIVLLSVETVVLETGFGWMVLVKLAGIATVVFLISRFASHLKNAFQTIIERTTHWRIHFMVLVILGVCAIGERFGLSATKTAFFLGIAMSRTGHDGVRLEDYIAPISQRLLIPIFFVTLGLQLDWRMLLTQTALLAVCTAFFLIGFREMMHRRLVRTSEDGQSWLLLCPNLTIVALAASALLEHGGSPEVAAWLVLTGLFVTIPSIFMLPPAKPKQAATVPPAPAPVQMPTIPQ